MYSSTVAPLTAAIACVASRPSLLQVLIYRHITPGLGCQLQRVSFGTSNHFKKEASETLDREKADALVLRFTEEERTTLLAALQSYQAKQVKAEYEGQLAAIRWRSKFGRPSKVPNVGDVDPTGSFCPVPEDWLIRKYEGVFFIRGSCLYNQAPFYLQLKLCQSLQHHNFFQLDCTMPYLFVGFGFLDNAIMIIAGDYIELMLGSVITISTMAAAALGNTFSDIMGIGSAWYVESLAAKVGIKPPALSPIQLDMKSSRWAANMGRCLGVTVGCILGMVPLLFMHTDKDKDNKDSKK